MLRRGIEREATAEAATEFATAVRLRLRCRLHEREASSPEEGSSPIGRKVHDTMTAIGTRRSGPRVVWRGPSLDRSVPEE